MIELILDSLKQHENKLNRFIEIFEEKIQSELDPEELKHYGAVSIHDKRSPHWTNYGQIIKRKNGVNGLELTTDRGYTLCLSGDCSDFDFLPILEF